MFASFAILLVFQCLGEGIVFIFGLPIPGPVAGMLLLLGALLAWPRLQSLVEEGARQLLSHLSLLFVPAGAGIVAAARGFALGLASHGIGTARAFQVSAEMGAYAGLGMDLNGVLTALIAPWLLPLLLRLC